MRKTINEIERGRHWSCLLSIHMKMNEIFKDIHLDIY